MGKVIAYVGTTRTIVVLEPDESEGPFLPLSVISDIGFALITAANTASGRAAIQAAARGSNNDITQMLGMSPVDAATQVLTPQGTANAAVLAAMLGGFFQISNVTILTGDATADASWGIVWIDASGGGFNVTVPRALSVTDKSFFAIKTGTDSNAVTFKDDLGALKFTMLTGGQAFALVSVHDGAVVAGGVQ